jgi:Leucine-rich repeat (LRR) protein
MFFEGRLSDEVLSEGPKKTKSKFETALITVVYASLVACLMGTALAAPSAPENITGHANPIYHSKMLLDEDHNVAVSFPEMLDNLDYHGGEAFGNYVMHTFFGANLDEDGDGLIDYDEKYVYKTDPGKKDSDDDGLDDKKEIELGTDPNNRDSDRDGNMDGNEVYKTGTSPLDPDPIEFPDPNLDAEIRAAINKQEGAIYAADLDGLKSLDASKKDIKDIAGLEYCSNLENLDLSNVPKDIDTANQIIGLLPLSGLTKLETLHLEGNQITEVSALSGLTKLTMLGLSENQITDVSWLSGLTNLKELYLDSNQITDVSPLSRLTKVEWLTLYYNQITDISPLSGLTNLTYLNLNINQITDISPLSGLTNMKMLIIGSNHITDVSPLAGLTNLTYLSLGSNQITDISPLSGLRNLDDLSLGGNQITDISPLSGLTKLTVLDLYGNKITNVWPLSGFSNLEELYLGYNHITDISPLLGLTKLETLHLEGNQITEVSALSGLTKLTMLGISKNQINDVSPLSGLTNLEKVDLSENPIADVSLLPGHTKRIGQKHWTKTFGGDYNDEGNSVEQTNDGGYIIAGTTSTSAIGGVDLWLIKTDANGNKLWDKTFEEGCFDQRYSVQETSDGGYIITGSTREKDVWLIKTDANGNKLWDKTFGGSEYYELDWGYSVRETSDGGYIMTGSTSSYAARVRDVWLIKTDANGNKLWDKTFGGSGFDEGYSVEQTNDGGYIIAGMIDTGLEKMEDVLLIKTDENGNKLWDKILGEDYDDVGYSVQQTTDGGYIIAGMTVVEYNPSFGHIDDNVLLIKTDENGNKLWDKTFGGDDDDVGYSVQQTKDGGYIIAGTTNSYGTENKYRPGYRNIWLIKTDAIGNKLWDKTFGGIAFEEGYSVQETSDGGYIITGKTSSYGTGSYDVWLIKTDSDGNA